MDENIFANGLMDSMASVQMLLNLQEKFEIVNILFRFFIFLFCVCAPEGREDRRR